jgi:hypothetical protein
MEFLRCSVCMTLRYWYDESKILWADLLGSTAFALVKGDITGNIAVSPFYLSYCDAVYSILVRV